MTFVNYILPSQHNVNTVYACFDGRKNSSDFTPYIIKSTDKGKTWTSIASNLPAGTIYAIQEDHIDSDILFIGTEWGVWLTVDGGKKWDRIRKGIPPIQVKDLTIQRRENDLVVATFGRGFYVLEDYSYIRELKGDVTEKDAHIFNIKDGLLYYPSTNTNYQGEVHFSVPNPSPEVKIGYYIKEGYETLKQKRIKAQKAAEKAGREIDFPTKEELEAESNELPARILFTISDPEGNIMRKIERPLRKGLGSISWEMRYMSSRGPAVPPGEYSIKIEKFVNGSFTTLLEDVKFKVKTLNNNALGTPDYKEKFGFLKEASDLNMIISSTGSYAGDLLAKIQDAKTRLVGVPENTNDLLLEAMALEEEIKDVVMNISGARAAGRLNSDSPSISSRARFAISANTSAEHGVTGAQREQFQIAKDKFSVEYQNLKQIVDSSIPSFKSKLKDVGILWMTGEFPVF